MGKLPTVASNRHALKLLRTKLVRGWGILRSLAMYYGIPLRGRKLRTFYGTFVGRGDLCFDVGANAGNRTKALNALGARVVSIEPQPHFARFLRILFSRKHEVTVLEAAVGQINSTVILLMNERHPTLTSTRRDWVDTVRSTTPFKREKWTNQIEVSQLTMDELIDRFGEPDFVKIDVEGNESAVLAGLSRPLKTMSFEFIPAAPRTAEQCIQRLSELGDYRYNYSLGEQMQLVLDNWIPPQEMLEILERMPIQGSSGDAYAVRCDVLTTFFSE